MVGGVVTNDGSSVNGSRLGAAGRKAGNSHCQFYFGGQRASVRTVPGRARFLASFSMDSTGCEEIAAGEDTFNYRDGADATRSTADGRPCSTVMDGVPLNHSKIGAAM